ncbi:O-antigen ligase family protein [Macrococcus caseolyticus]|uniref:O-antigen ligase family protein n=1 Tax=Macrococcoides caseolyticum TaxID=69966 RepID=UPI0024BC6168|nr:O-antigen ligase family protein [Macrococcus caseolyticus]MDJ1090130.1 O-antigen ligase family protein [Macrococcus caseolyticus]
MKSLLVEIMKITILFLYLNLGIQLYATNKLKILLNSFVYASILISAFGLIINHAGGAIKPYLFFGGFRFKGLLNDPNLFAVSQVIALSLLRDMNLSSIKKYLYLTIILSGIILSGSKTGLICLIVFMIITFLKVIRQITSKDIVKYISVLLIVLVFIYFSKGIVVPESFLDSVNRMSQLITDSTTSINESGSSRGNAWNIAIKIIYNSLFLGTGLGTYLLISKNIFNTNVLAHNTYLQLTAEWGLLITLIIVTLILIKLLFILFNYKKIDDTFLGELILYFLIGSFSLSLNNSRLFWLLLGPFLMIKLVNKKMKR